MRATTQALILLRYRGFNHYASPTFLLSQVLLYALLAGLFATFYYGQTFNLSGKRNTPLIETLFVSDALVPHCIVVRLRDKGGGPPLPPLRAVPLYRRWLTALTKLKPRGRAAQLDANRRVSARSTGILNVSAMIFLSVSTPSYMVRIFPNSGDPLFCGRARAVFA